MLRLIIKVRDYNHKIFKMMPHKIKNGMMAYFIRCHFKKQEKKLKETLIQSVFLTLYISNTNQQTQLNFENICYFVCQKINKPI